jgi:hypothetical protein
VADASRPTDPAGVAALSDASGHVTRYLENVEDTRQRTQLLYEQLQSRLSETMSHATYNLAVIAPVDILDHRLAHRSKFLTRNDACGQRIWLALDGPGSGFVVRNDES